MGTRHSPVTIDEERPGSPWSGGYDSDSVGNNMALLGTIAYFAGMFVIGMFVWSCHRRLSANRKSPPPLLRGAHQQHSLSHQQTNQPPPPKKNGMTAKEKAARKIFLKENLPTKEWIVSSSGLDSLEAGDEDRPPSTDSKNSNNNGARSNGGNSDTCHEVSLNKDGETTCTNDSVLLGDTNCPICLIPFQKGDLISCSTDPGGGGCQHIFHKQCVYAWLLDHQECPVCRQNFLPSPGEEEDDEETNNSKTTAMANSTTESSFLAGIL